MELVERKLDTTEGSETSQYLEESKAKSDSASSGERTRTSPNRSSDRGCGHRLGVTKVSLVESTGKLNHRR